MLFDSINNFDHLNMLLEGSQSFPVQSLPLQSFTPQKQSVLEITAFGAKMSGHEPENLYRTFQLVCMYKSVKKLQAVTC